MWQGDSITNFQSTEYISCNEREVSEEVRTLDKTPKPVKEKQCGMFSS